MRTLMLSIFHTTILIISTTVQLIASESSNNPPFSCDPSNPSTNSLPFCSTKLPISSRVKDLVTRLTLDEKVQQLVNGAAAVPRLNISAYEWWSEALHGVSKHGKGVRFNGTITSATMFPQIILTAASFDPHLWYLIAQAIGDEARAIFNAGQVRGLTFWAPNINIFRDPRWGRGQETVGEDPLLAGEYAVAYVRGIEGDSFEGGRLKDGHLKISACCKHYTAHDLDNWNGITRYVFDAKVNRQDLADTYQPPFKACVEKGRASGIMCAYNRVNGVPACADYGLLTQTARNQWGFKGYICSDCDAVAIMHDEQGYAKEPEDAVAKVLKAGMDVNCGDYLKRYTKSALEKKKVSVVDVNRALENLFSVRMRLGLFNGDPRKLEYGELDKTHVCSQTHLNLALEAAKSGIVLLKNQLSLLPFSKSPNMSLAVIGPNANNSEVFLGNYEGLPCSNITILQAIQNNYVNNTKYNMGCDFVNCTKASVNEAVAITKQADYVVLVMGLDQTIEREKHDRAELGLPGSQENVITSVAKAAMKPVVLVLLCGGPVDVSFAKDNAKIGSILWAGYPGEAGGIAVAETLFGDNNPGGRLPVTWYPMNYTMVPMTDMRMRANSSSGYPGRTYRFYTGPKVYEYGYGLSYTNYSYNFVSLNKTKISLNIDNAAKKTISVAKLGPKFCDSLKFSAKVGVQNKGERAGKHPVLLFVRSDEKTVGKGKPRKQLVGFKRVDLSGGEREELEFVVNPCEHISYADEDGLIVIERGMHYLVVGDQEHPISVS